jgi:hypothetical protein
MSPPVREDLDPATERFSAILPQLKRKPDFFTSGRDSQFLKSQAFFSGKIVLHRNY